MDLRAALENPWVLGVASSLMGAILYPLLRKAGERLRACFGPFSGQYIAVTWQPQPTGEDLIEIEDVRCHHNGRRISGKIYGVAIGKLEETGEVSELLEEKGVYRFDGFVDERVFVVSYRTLIPALHSCGAIALQADSSGRMFVGSWVGLAGEGITKNACAWIKMERRISSRWNRAQFMARFWQDYPLLSQEVLVANISILKSTRVYWNDIEQAFSDVPIRYPDKSAPRNETDAQQPHPSAAEDRASDA